MPVGDLSLHELIGSTQIEERDNLVGNVSACVAIAFIVKTGNDAIEPYAPSKLHKCSSSTRHHLIEDL
jgi:hypothetical protein